MTSLSELVGSRWAGASELWLDPLGDQAESCPCTITVDDGILFYTWSREGTDHQGTVRLRTDGADFTDTWHSPESMDCKNVAGGRALLQVEGHYGPEADWGWRIGLCLRTPTGELVLQMTNIAPWGEEARAVRMVCQRQ